MDRSLLAIQRVIGVSFHRCYILYFNVDTLLTTFDIGTYAHLNDIASLSDTIMPRKANNPPSFR